MRTNTVRHRKRARESEYTRPRDRKQASKQENGIETRHMLPTTKTHACPSGGPTGGHPAMRKHSGNAPPKKCAAAICSQCRNQAEYDGAHDDVEQEEDHETRLHGCQHDSPIWPVVCDAWRVAAEILLKHGRPRHVGWNARRRRRRNVGEKRCVGLQSMGNGPPATMVGHCEDRKHRAAV